MFILASLMALAAAGAAMDLTASRSDDDWEEPDGLSPTTGEVDKGEIGAISAGSGEGGGPGGDAAEPDIVPDKPDLAAPDTDDKAIDGGDGADDVFGGAGDDALAPGASDFAEGQEGAVRFELWDAPGELPIIADFNAGEDQLVLHLPESVTDDAKVDLAADKDGTFLVTVNGEAIGRMLQTGGLSAADIVVVRRPG